MFVVPDEIRFPVRDHLRVTDRMLRLIHQLSHGPASCDHRLIERYASQALSHLQAAESLLNERKENGGGARNSECGAASNPVTDEPPPTTSATEIDVGARGAVK